MTVRRPLLLLLAGTLLLLGVNLAANARAARRVAEQARRAAAQPVYLRYQRPVVVAPDCAVVPRPAECRPLATPTGALAAPAETLYAAISRRHAVPLCRLRPAIPEHDGRVHPAIYRCEVRLGDTIAHLIAEPSGRVREFWLSIHTREPQALFQAVAGGLGRRYGRATRECFPGAPSTAGREDLFWYPADSVASARVSWAPDAAVGDPSGAGVLFRKEKLGGTHFCWID